MFSRKLRMCPAWLPLIAATLLAPTHSAQVTMARAQQPQRPAATPAPLFDFHSDFWVNLHQALFAEALARTGRPDRRLQSATALVATPMSAAEKSEWNAAVRFYATHFEGRTVLFDALLIRINDTLAKQPDDTPSLDPAGLPADIVPVLRSAAPIYRRYGWPAQHRANMDWIASQRGHLRDFGPALATAMTRDLQQSWPSRPIRVDVCYHVAEIGHAYTTDRPPHITYSSTDPTHEGLNGFELLFHEASHTFADVETDSLTRACTRERKDCGQLWHALLFYTSGVELRRLLPPDERAGFTPYAYRYGVYTHGDWPRYLRVLETAWQAYLDGKIRLRAAIRAMAAELR